MEIFKAHDFYTPFYEIKVGDETLDTDVSADVMQITYRDSLEGIDTFEITVNNWDPKTQGRSTAKYIGPGLGDQKDKSQVQKERIDLFEPGKRLGLSMGYHKANAPQVRNRLAQQMIVGEITTLAVNLPAAGQPTLRVSGQNILRRFLTKQVTEAYKGKRDSEIFVEVFDRGNLPSDVVQSYNIKSIDTNEQPRKFVEQDNQYDIVFMMSLARHAGYDLWLKKVENGPKPKSVLFFGTSTQGSQTKDLILEWGKSLIKFQPTLTIVRQVGSVTVRGWDPDKKKPIVATAKLADLDARTLRSLDQQGRLEGSFSHRSDIVVDKPVHSEDEAKKLAIGKLKKLAQQTITCSGATVGLPALRSGAEVEMRGVGTTFSGRYVLTSTTHTIGANGYQTEFEARKEERKQGGL